MISIMKVQGAKRKHDNDNDRAVGKHNIIALYQCRRVMRKWYAILFQGFVGSRNEPLLASRAFTLVQLKLRI